ncbi:TIR domain-containing protein [Archangium gephyra]|uniref:TIR domain-containing protein n=1 Tax=Archangium gephyra TaxID=48 RepID=UPI003B7F9DE8
MVGWGKPLLGSDNAIFEAGFFMHAKGPRRTLTIREKGATMPPDLGGAIYVELKDCNDISTIQDLLLSFVTHLKGG